MTASIISAISAILLALSVLYATRQLVLLRQQHKQNHDWNRRLAAQQAVKEYRELQIFVETISLSFDYHNRTEGIPLDEITKEFKSTSHLQSRTHTVLNYYEGLARGVRQGIYDEKVIKNAFRGNMIRTFEAFKYYIEDRRRKLHNPKFWVELEEMADIWRKENRVIDPVRAKTGITS